MFSAGGFCKAYKTILSKKRDSRGKSNRNGHDHHPSNKGSNHDPRFHEDEGASVSSSFFKRVQNLPQSKAQSPLKRRTSLDDGSSNSRNKSKNPVSISANNLIRKVSHENASETLTHTELDKANKLPDSLPRSLTQTSSQSRKYYSRRGSLSELHSIHEDDPWIRTEKKVMSRSMTSRQGTVPIRFSSSNGLLKPLANEKTLECTLEELCFGCVKRISVSRDAINDIGFLTREEEQLTINVQPGWKKGTKLTFPGTGNEKLGTCPADIILMVTEKKHPTYARRGSHDLAMELKIPLVDALTGCTITVPLLGGEETQLKLDDELIEPGFERVLVGQGMPMSKEHGSRGNLVLQFLVDFPKELTDEQRRQLCNILQSVC